MTSRWMAAVICATMVTGGLTAQQPAFHSETKLVVLRATVRNSHGVEIINLDQNAFTVYENGRPQRITLFQRNDIPVSMALLIDNSGSMRPFRARAEAAALAFIRASNPLDEACVMNFADKPSLDVALTSDLATLEAGIARIDSIGGTALRDAVEMAETYLHDHASRERRVLLVITDGRDNASRVTLRQIEQLSRKSDSAVYAIGLLGSADSSQAKDGRHELDALTERTGGVAYYPTSVDDLNAMVVAMAQQIRHQYTIAYEPTDQTRDGTYRRIQVAARGREPLTVRTRAGYVASPRTGVVP